MGTAEDFLKPVHRPVLPQFPIQFIASSFDMIIFISNKIYGIPIATLREIFYFLICSRFSSLAVPPQFIFSRCSTFLARSFCYLDALMSQFSSFQALRKYRISIATLENIDSFIFFCMLVLP